MVELEGKDLLLVVHNAVRVLARDVEADLGFGACIVWTDLNASKWLLDRLDAPKDLDGEQLAVLAVSSTTGTSHFTCCCGCCLWL